MPPNPHIRLLQCYFVFCCHWLHFTATQGYWSSCMRNIPTDLTFPSRPSSGWVSWSPVPQSHLLTLLVGWQEGHPAPAVSTKILLRQIFMGPGLTQSNLWKKIGHLGKQEAQLMPRNSVRRDIIWREEKCRQVLRRCTAVYRMRME